MQRLVYLHLAPPRTMDHLNASLSECLANYFLGGGALIVIGLIFFIIAIIKRKIVALYIVAILGLLIGATFIYIGNNITAARETVFNYGQVVYAEVLEHGRTEGFFGGEKDYTVSLSLKTVSGEVVKKNLSYHTDELWEIDPIGGQVVGLEHEGKFLFGEDIRCSFKVYKEERKK